MTLMRAFCIEFPRFQRFQRVLVAILLAHLFAIMALAASPALHEWIHADSHETDHQCAVVLFTGGGAEAAVVIAFVVALMVTIVSQAMPRCDRVERLFRVLRILEHAPPAAA
jgi:hypothetical protein